MTKIILLCLLAVLMVFACAACSQDAPPAEQDTTPADTTTPAETQPPVQKVSVALTGEVNYKIIRAEDADEAITKIGSDMWNSLHDITGSFDIRISDDFVKSAEDVANDDKEILLGITNRPASARALAELPTYLDYSISVIDNKIVICANTAERLAQAAEYFVSCVSMQDGVAVYNNDETVVNSYDGYKYKDLMLAGKKISDYAIVVPKDSESETSFAQQLALWLATSCGYKPAVVDDSTAPSACEIIIGVTNRNTGVTADGLNRPDCRIKAFDGGLAMVAISSGGYKFGMEKLEEMMNAGGVAPGVDQLLVGDNSGLDGARVMFIGNSFTYYGHCCGSKENNPLGGVDKRYFYQVAKDFGDEVTVTNFTLGGASLWHKKGKVAEKSLYTQLIQNHPNHYQNSAGRPMDKIYDQDYVILQQSGDNINETYSDSKAIMALFPPETKFYFYITTHDLSSNHTPTIQAAEKMLTEGSSAGYIPLGHMVYRIWIGAERVSGAAVKYNKSTFIVNQSSSDGYHPNHLTGYLTALMTYCTITGRSAQGADYSFVVKDNKTYYTNGTTNYPDVLNSPDDMAALQTLIDKYIQQYNQK